MINMTPEEQEDMTYLRGRYDDKRSPDARFLIKPVRNGAALFFVLYAYGKADEIHRREPELLQRTTLLWTRGDPPHQLVLHLIREAEKDGRRA